MGSMRSPACPAVEPGVSIDTATFAGLERTIRGPILEYGVVMVDVPMARPLRIESPGALYHVILLGNLRLSRLATARFCDEPS